MIPLFYAILTTCYVEGSHTACVDHAPPVPYRTLSDCLIAVEKVERSLRSFRSELYMGGCTQAAPSEDEVTP